VAASLNVYRKNVLTFDIMCLEGKFIGGLNMFVYAILLYILIDLQAPEWCYILLGAAAFIRISKFGFDLVNKKRLEDIY